MKINDRCFIVFHLIIALSFKGTLNEYSHLHERFQSKGGLQSPDGRGVEHAFSDWGFIGAVLDEDDLVEFGSSLGTLSLHGHFHIDCSVSE